MRREMLDLEGLLPADHRARVVWAFAERLDFSALYARIGARAGEPGHPPPDPRIMVALWLYATLEGVGRRGSWRGCAKVTWRIAGCAVACRRITTV